MSVDVSDHFGDRWQSAKDAEWQARLDAERALADAAADIIANNRGDEDEMEQWLARYRETRQR